MNKKGCEYFLFRCAPAETPPPVRFEVMHPLTTTLAICVGALLASSTIRTKHALRLRINTIESVDFLSQENYLAGDFSYCNSQQIVFTPSFTMTRLYTFDYHKVEAIELVPGTDGGMVFGTDDENLGAAIYLN